MLKIIQIQLNAHSNLVSTWSISIIFQILRQISSWLEESSYFFRRKLSSRENKLLTNCSFCHTLTNQGKSKDLNSYSRKMIKLSKLQTKTKTRFTIVKMRWCNSVNKNTSLIITAMTNIWWLFQLSWNKKFSWEVIWIRLSHTIF